MLRELVIYGDERLQQVSEKIETIDDEIRTLIDDMFETMYKERGVGLAAVQVGILKKLIVISVPDFDDEKKPEHLHKRESEVYEICFSRRAEHFGSVRNFCFGKYPAFHELFFRSRTRVVLCRQSDEREQAIEEIAHYRET